MPGWDQAPLRRLVLVEGYVAGIVSAESGHVVGLNCRGYIFCSRFGNMLTARDVPEATRLVLGRVWRVRQVWYILLPRQEVIGTRPRVLGAEGFPSWHKWVGEQRLWRVICTVLSDWRQRRTRRRSAASWTLLNVWLSLGILFPPSHRGWRVILHGSLQCPEN